MIKIHQIKNTQKGSILVESLISLIIVVPAIIALMSLYTSAIKSASINQNYNNAVYLAQEKLEDLKQFDGSSTIKNLPANITHPDSKPVDGVVYSFKIDPFTPIGGNLDSHIFPYQITVSWTDTSVTPATSRYIQVAAYYYSN